MKPDKKHTYYITVDQEEQTWEWGERLASYIGSQKAWIQFDGCGYDCCGEIWEVDSMTEEEFATYLASFSEEDIWTL